MIDTTQKESGHSVNLPKWLVVFLCSCAALGPIGGGASIISVPDIELAKRQAIEEAVEKSQRSTDKELERMEKRLGRIETKLDRLLEAR